MATTVVTQDGHIGPGNEKIKFTPEGALVVRMTNKTGSASVKGELVEASTGTDEAFMQASADSDDPIGIVYEAGVADGSECWIVKVGLCQVLLKDSTAATRHNWIKSSDTAGRADATSTTPPGAVAAHFQEIGHCIETKTGGTDVLAKATVHFL